MEQLRAVRKKGGKEDVRWEEGERGQGKRKKTKRRDEKKREKKIN